MRQDAAHPRRWTQWSKAISYQNRHHTTTLGICHWSLIDIAPIFICNWQRSLFCGHFQCVDGDVPWTWAHGQDYSVESALKDDETVINIEISTDNGKLHHSGPKFRYSGQAIDYIIYALKNGEITGNIFWRYIIFWSNSIIATCPKWSHSHVDCWWIP